MAAGEKSFRQVLASDRFAYGVEKLQSIKCRKAGLRPDAVVLVARVRALKMHGGLKLEGLARPDVRAVERGMANLEKHIENLGRFGVPVVVAINSFTGDTPEEIAVIRQRCQQLGVQAVQADHWARGGQGAEELAQTVVDLPLRDAHVCTGAGFIVVLTGDIMTMPGLPRVPASEGIDIDEQGRIVGLS